jgi:hypothetical protein
MSVLMLAVENASSPEVVKLLLDHKADATDVDGVQYSCLLL